MSPFLARPFSEQPISAQCWRVGKHTERESLAYPRGICVKYLTKKKLNFSKHSPPTPLPESRPAPLMTFSLRPCWRGLQNNANSS